MLDLRNLKVAAPGIMRRAPASEFNGTKNLPQCAVCIRDGDVRFLTLYQLALVLVCVTLH